MTQEPIHSDLASLAQACIIQSANSTQPRRVLTEHFEKAFQLGYQAGKQQGLTQSAIALDLLAGEDDGA